LKPENIFLSLGDERRVQPKLLDFGIALSPGSDRITSKRRIAATPEYAAPEQARGSSTLDARVDVWGFCLVLYETITQRRPFHDSSSGSIAVDAPELAAEGVEDAALRSLIERGLRQDPNARWSSMLEVGEALARWLVAQGVDDDVTGTTLAASWPNLGGADGRPRENSIRPMPAPQQRSFQVPYTAGDTTTLDVALAGADDASANDEPSLLAPRPSEQPAPLEALSKSPPPSQRARWRAWGLSGSLLSLLG
jgi:serine/threonine-protein kinase